MSRPDAGDSAIRLRVESYAYAAGYLLLKSQCHLSAPQRPLAHWRNLNDNLLRSIAIGERERELALRYRRAEDSVV